MDGLWQVGCIVSDDAARFHYQDNSSALVIFDENSVIQIVCVDIKVFFFIIRTAVILLQLLFL